MFNFNTGKKTNEPNLNTAAVGAENTQFSASQNIPNQTATSDANAQINAQVNRIEAQRMDFIRKNPNFDMKAEMQNPAFIDYVWRNNLSVEDAYFLVHKEEIIDKAVADALYRIDARKGRITENGAGNNSPVSVKKNPKDMSDKEIDSIIERVRNGEKISF